MYKLKRKFEIKYLHTYIFLGKRLVFHLVFYQNRLPSSIILIYSSTALKIYLKLYALPSPHYKG